MKFAGWNDMPCPACKEPVSVAATRCPHCQIDYTIDQQKDRQDRHRKQSNLSCLGCLGLLFLIALLAFAPWGSAAPEDDPTEVPSTRQSDTPKDIEQAEREARDTVEAVSLPDGAPAAPVTVGQCRDTLCAINRVDFTERDWPKAWRDDYQGQRNVAFCLQNGCFGAVQVDRISGCAWRSIILDRNAESADQTDTANFELDCGSLTPVEQDLAMSKADLIDQRLGDLGF